MMSFTQLSSSDASTSNKLWEFIVIITHFTVCLVIKTHILVKPYLTAGSTLVKGMNHSSFQPLILYLICLSGDMSLPSTHADCVSSQLTQTRDLYFFFLNSPDKLCVGKRRRKSLSFYISIFAREADKQPGMSMCGSAASDWCEITVMAAHSGTTNTHIQTLSVGEVAGCNHRQLR